MGTSGGATLEGPRAWIARTTPPGASVGWLPLAIGTLIVVVFAWTPMVFPPAGGVDPSWAGGLYMALERGLDHGTDIVFTYGPLGPLGIDGGELWYSDIAMLALVFQTALFVGVCFYLVSTLQRSIGLPAAVLGAFAVLVTADSPEIVLVLVAGIALTALAPDAPGWSRTVLLAAGSFLAAIECLIKLSLGPVIFVAVLLALIGTRPSPKRVALFLGLFVAEFLILWLIAGQSLGALPDYVTNARQVIGGYSEGFGTVAYGRWYAPVAGLIVIGLAASAALTSGPGRRERVFGGLCILVIAFSIFKESVVRLDPPHVPVFLSTALLIWPLMAWRGKLRLGMAAGAVGLVALVLHVSELSANADPSPFENASRFGDTFKLAFSPSERNEETNSTREGMKFFYDLPQEIQDDLDGQSVAIEPFEIAVAWAYDLDWDPLPVIQGYAAYTPALDQLNADDVASDDGPDRILRHNLQEMDGRLYAVDSRLETWEAPAQTVAEACHFQPQVTTDRWQLMERIPDRCGEPTDAGSVQVNPGEVVDVPPSKGDLIVAELHGVDLSGFSKLESLLLRGDGRYLAYDDDNVFRITPATAADGYLISGPRSVVGDGPFALAPNASTLTAYGDSGPVTFDFLRIPVSGGRR